MALKWYWEAVIEDILHKYLNKKIQKILQKIYVLQNSSCKVYSCICVQNLWKIPMKEFNFSKVADVNRATVVKNWAPMQVFFDWFLHSCRTAFLGNTSHWLPMCPAWKKKNERNKMVCFYCTQSDILLSGITRFSRGNKNKLRTF